MNETPLMAARAHFLVALCLALVGCRSTNSSHGAAPERAVSSAAVTAASSTPPASAKVHAAPPVANATSPSASAAATESSSSAPGSEVSSGAEGHKSFLWKITSPVATAHLLGSVHVAKEGTYPLSDSIEQAFANATTLVVEVDHRGDRKARAAQTMLERAVYESGDTISRHISRDTYGKLRLHLLTSGQPSKSMDQLRPWFVGVTLTLQELQRHGFSLERGIDEYFLGRAEGKQVEALETIQQQVAVLSGLDEQTQAELLTETLDQMPTVGSTMTEALALWKRGDARGLDELLVRPQKQRFPRVYENLLTKRNRTMAARIEELLRKEGHYFVVVGAAHLVGEDGVTSLLRAKGRTPVQL